MMSEMPAEIGRTAKLWWIETGSPAESLRTFPRSIGKCWRCFQRRPALPRAVRKHQWRFPERLRDVATVRCVFSTLGVRHALLIQEGEYERVVNAPAA